MFIIPRCIIEDGRYYGTIDGWKLRIISIRMAEAVWGVSYGNVDGAIAHYGAEEQHKLRNMSCRSRGLSLRIFAVYH